MVKVVLTKDVEALGKAGELKEVSPGYLRNFLVPKHLAVLATASELKTLETRRAQIAKAQQKQRTEAEAVAAQLAGVSLTFQVRVGEQIDCTARSRARTLPMSLRAPRISPSIDAILICPSRSRRWATSASRLSLGTK